jgi:hypothetical protein
VEATAVTALEDSFHQESAYLKIRRRKIRKSEVNK